jgi:hypothetical protein
MFLTNLILTMCLYMADCALVYYDINVQTAPGIQYLHNKEGNLLAKPLLEKGLFTEATIAANLVNGGIALALYQFDSSGLMSQVYLIGVGVAEILVINNNAQIIKQSKLQYCLEF